MAVKTGCPHLGLRSDPTIRFVTPSRQMVCHKANPAGRVDLSHQEIYCVTEFHDQCEVFLHIGEAPLPIHLQRPDTPKTNRARLRQKLAFWPAVVGLIAILIISVIGLRFLMRSAVISAETPPANPSATSVVSTSTAPATATLLPATATPTAVIVAPATIAPTQPVIILQAPSPTALPPTATPESTATPLIWIPARTLRSVNVRTGPSTFFPVLTTIDSDVELAVVASDGQGGGQGDWYQICCSDNVPGWVAAINLTLVPEGGQTVPAPVEQPHVIVFAENANVREGPGLEYQIVRNLEQGNSYDVVARSPGIDFQWFEVCCFAGESGWVNIGTVVFSGALTDVAINEAP